MKESRLRGDGRPVRAWDNRPRLARRAGGRFAMSLCSRACRGRQNKGAEKERERKKGSRTRTSNRREMAVLIVKCHRVLSGAP